MSLFSGQKVTFGATFELLWESPPESHFLITFQLLCIFRGSGACSRFPRSQPNGTSVIKCCVKQVAGGPEACARLHAKSGEPTVTARRNIHQNPIPSHSPECRSRAPCIHQSSSEGALGMTASRMFPIVWGGGVEDGCLIWSHCKAPVRGVSHKSENCFKIVTLSIFFRKLFGKLLTIFGK